jgi:uncharacterized protein YegJ (DUF2314 family)
MKIEYPPICNTFELPSLRGVTIGDIVKLIFSEEGTYSERMWVRVISISKKWIGILDSKPMYLKSVQYEDKVGFFPSQIIDVWKEVTNE